MSDDPRIVVEVAPDVTGIDRRFDYLVPDEFVEVVVVGSKVRVDLNGRRVAGWVIAKRFEEESDTDLKPILKWMGVGPDEDVLAVCAWAARRWCSPRLRPFLVTASAPVLVQRAAPKHRTVVHAAPVSPAASDLLQGGGGVLRLPATSDQLPAVLSASRMGPTLVVCASIDASRIMAARLKRAGLTVALVPQDWSEARGGVDVTIGARSAAFAPCPEMAAAVVLDEHEESLQEERMPTWHARDVLQERCRRAGVPLLLVTPCPSAVGLHHRRVVGPPAEREVLAWPNVSIVDRGQDPPWNRSILSSDVISLARDSTVRMVCVANTRGLAQLLACRTCDALVRCDSCRATMSELEEGRLDCTSCGSTRPRVCASCSSASISRIRPGVTRLREELEKAAHRPVMHVDASNERFDDSSHSLFIGTNASLNRLRHIDVVAFLDFDRELLAPRFTAHEQALALVVSAARLVGPRATGGRVLLQTTLLDHDVVRAAVSGHTALVSEAETRRRELLGLPPFSALAAVSGESVDDCAVALTGRMGITATRHRDRLLIRASDHETLSAAWFELPAKTRSGVRIEVDPGSV